MGVRVKGVTPDCCPPGCKNRPEAAWDVFTSSPGGSVAKRGPNNLEFHANSGVGIVISFDTDTTQDPQKNFCFSASILMKSGLNTGSGLVGLGDSGTVAGLTRFINISYDSVTPAWTLVWRNNGSITTHTLTNFGPTRQQIKLCRVGDIITLNMNGNTFSFPVDGNFPTESLSPIAGGIGITTNAIFDVANFCLT